MDFELAAIQKRVGVTADGIWGPVTRAAIARELGVKVGVVVPLPAAPWLNLARQEIGIKETPGAGNTAAVAAYFKASVGVTYADSVAWCAAFVGAMLESTGYAGTHSLMARSYLEWGTPLATPVRGCVVVFKRGAPPSGHVAFVDEVIGARLRCIGGNQSDAVTEALFAKSSVLGYRWPLQVAA